MDDVLDAMSTSEMDPVRFHLDLETGAVESQLTSEIFAELGEESTEFDRLLEQNPSRYEDIPTYGSRAEYRLMCEFVEAIEEDDIRAQLDVALQGKGAFRRFRDVVFAYPDLKTAWLERRQQALLEEALAWLDSLDIEPIYELRPIEPEPSAATAPRAESGPRITLLDMLLLGAPDGKTERLDGQVLRQFQAQTPSHARTVFKRLAREICEYHGVAWRKRFIENTSRFDLERAHLEVDGTMVRLFIEVPPPIWKVFGG